MCRFSGRTHPREVLREVAETESKETCPHPTELGFGQLLLADQVGLYKFKVYVRHPPRIHS